MEKYQEETLERVLKDIAMLVATMDTDDLTDVLQQDFATADGGSSVACHIFAEAVSRALGRANLPTLRPQDEFQDDETAYAKAIRMGADRIGFFPNL